MAVAGEITELEAVNQTSLRLTPGRSLPPDQVPWLSGVKELVKQIKVRILDAAMISLFP
jgi:hypothetical protein